MAVINELARGEDCRHELGAIDDRIETALEQAHHLGAGVALAAHGFLVVAAELALADIAVVALETLLRHQLDAEVGGLAAALAVLARPVFAAVEGALGTAPEVDAEASVNLVLGFCPFGHGSSFIGYMSR